jgi:hypothetical protein
VTPYIAAPFVLGAIVMGHIVAGAFFLRFWHRTRDQLFLWFGAAFWLMALQQALVAFTNIMQEDQSWTYVIRLLAFLLIIVAIVRKNFEARTKS